MGTNKTVRWRDGYNVSYPYPGIEMDRVSDGRQNMWERGGGVNDRRQDMW